jgi:hypothetical protein
MKKIFASALIASLLLISLTAGGCTSQKGFSIYLTRQDTPVSAMPALSQVELADKPIISIDDIISYTKETHEIELTADAYERVTELEVPTWGRVFIVCVDRKPIYWGAFWVGWSSLSFDGVTIMLPSFSPDGHLIQLELGYPVPGFYSGEDPRSNPEIFQSLEQAGKLK